MWKVFERREDVFGGVRTEFRELVDAMLKYESRARVTAEEVSFFYFHLQPELLFYSSVYDGPMLTHPQPRPLNTSVSHNNPDKTIMQMEKRLVPPIPPTPEQHPIPLTQPLLRVSEPK